MKPMKHLVSLTIFLLLFAFASQSYADISDAALLYLRIAPGSRPAGMGEAYVAISDDATATHWNPAGLGTSPLSNTWQNKHVPNNLKPITAMAAINARGGSDHNSYDIWTLTTKGLARYDNHHWFLYEVFSTKTDQTVSGIVKNYFNITDESALQEATAKVVTGNSYYPFETVEKFRTDVLAATPEDYSDLEAFTSELDSLIELYHLCKINWQNYKEAISTFEEGMKDSVLSEKEIDRINFAVEKSKSRFIPEELKIQYSSLFSGELVDIKAIGSILIVGTTNGLFSFDGRSWKSFSLEDGLPSMHILSLAATSNACFVGTVEGIVSFNGYTVEQDLDDGSNISKGAVTAIGAKSAVDVWAVIDDELYHYDGQSWSSSYVYTVGVDDNLETIAEKAAIYGTASEKEKIIEKIKELYSSQPVTTAVEEPTEAFIVGDDSTTIVLDENIAAEDTTVVTEESISDTVETVEETAEETVELTPKELTAVEPGMEIRVPYAVGFVGDVSLIHISLNKQLWIGTDYGLLSFQYRLGSGIWKLTGYKEITVTEGQTLEDIATSNPHTFNNSEEYISIIKEINGLTSETLSGDQTLKVYSNPTALPINDVMNSGGNVIIATTKGLYELNDNTLNKVDKGGMGYANVLKVETHGNEVWYASDSKIAIKANGNTEIAAMFAKWLPELADDIYYGYLAGVTGIDGFGTVGLSFTYISYGTIYRTDDIGNPLGTFEPYDLAFSGSYGTSIFDNLKGGVSLKLLISHLSIVGAGVEQGKGTATGLAIDGGLIYQLSPKFNIGMAVTNIGPRIAYIDAGQSDPLPRNLALGFSWKLLSSEYYHLLFTSEMNKSLVGVDDGFKEELKQMVFNSGAEFSYADIFAVRGGYIHDEEGDIKTITIGVGLSPINKLNFDFAYIPSGTEAPLANTLRTSLSYSW